MKDKYQEEKAEEYEAVTDTTEASNSYGGAGIGLLSFLASGSVTAMIPFLRVNL